MDNRELTEYLRFLEFLREHNAYESVETACSQEYGASIYEVFSNPNNVIDPDLIAEYFNWDEREEDYEFWEELDDLWRGTYSHTSDEEENEEDDDNLF